MEVRQCSVCHCTEQDPCYVHGVSCCWLEEDLCAACAPIEKIVTDPIGQVWNLEVIAEAQTGLYEPYKPCLAATRYELAEQALADGEISRGRDLLDAFDNQAARST